MYKTKKFVLSVESKILLKCLFHYKKYIIEKKYRILLHLKPLEENNMDLRKMCLDTDSAENCYEYVSYMKHQKEFSLK